MKKPRHVTAYGTKCMKCINKTVSAMESVDTYDTLSGCTEIYHILSGNFVKEHLNPQAINAVKRSNNFFINLN